MSERRLADKRVIVTGAAGGIGRAFALHLAGLGARVLAADLNRAGAEETAGLIGGDGGEALAAAGAGGAAVAAAADVSSAADAEALARAAEQAWGGLDGLVNNAAAIGGVSRRGFEQIPEDEWDRLMEVNVKGTWLCTKAAAALLRDSGGAVVNVSSEVVLTGSTGLAHYVASKGAVVSLTRVLARELGPDGVRVNAIAPGFMETEGTRAIAPPGSYDVSATPLNRLGEPEDLLGALAFLLSDESGFVTGQNLLVNGGRVLQ